MKWTCYPIDKFGEFSHLWNALNEKTANSPLLDPIFIAPLLEEFGNANEIMTLCMDRDNFIAAGIFSRTKPGSWHTFQPSQSPLGLWISNSSLPIHVLLASLAKALPGLNMIVSLTQQDPDFMEKPRAKTRLDMLNYIDTARLKITGSFDSYWKSRGRNLRHNLKRQRNRLKREGIETKLEVVTEPAEIEDAIEQYGDLESVGWKGEKGTAVHPANSQGRFYTKVLTAFCERGDGRVYKYWYNDKITAMDLCINNNNTMIILKTCYDEQQKTSSPAFLMRQESFKNIFDQEEFSKIEFYGRVMDWHKKWTNDDIRTMFHVNCYRLPVLNKLHHAIKKTTAGR